MQSFITTSTKADIKAYKIVNPTLVVTRLTTNPDVFFVIGNSPPEVGEIIYTLPDSASTGTPIRAPGRVAGRKLEDSVTRRNHSATGSEDEIIQE